MPTSVFETTPYHWHLSEIAPAFDAVISAALDAAVA